MMEEAALLRRVAQETVSDIEPVQLQEDLLVVIDSTSMVPGVLTLLTAEHSPRTADDVQQRAVGVQLIYTGLSLTRQLASTEPWTNNEPEGADLQILTADVLVARGFGHLGHTECASPAVDVVRSFGQTRMSDHSDDEPTAALERDVIALALRAGVAETTGTPPGLGRFAADLAPSTAGFPEPGSFFSESVMKRLSLLVVKPPADP